MCPPSPSAAASICPSVDEATDNIRLKKALLVVHDAPELVEVQIWPAPLPAPATNLVPSAEQAIVHAPPGAALEIQEEPESSDM
jgi:hypothetical protein